MADYNPNNINHGDIVITRYGSFGFVVQAYFNRRFCQNYYAIEWIKIVPRDAAELNYSVIFNYHEVMKMKKRLQRLRSRQKI